MKFLMNFFVILFSSNENCSLEQEILNEDPKNYYANILLGAVYQENSPTQVCRCQFLFKTSTSPCYFDDFIFLSFITTFEGGEIFVQSN